MNLTLDYLACNHGILHSPSTSCYVFTKLWYIFQVAMVLQEWYMVSSWTRITLINGYQESLQCSNFDHFLLENTHAMVLLGVQILVSPFIISSKRNYKEGLLFCCGTFACLFVWIGWTIPFALFEEHGQNWRDVTVCCALVAIPTVLILVIFLPKVRTAYQFSC